MAGITPPTNELNYIIKGDLDILNALNVDNGTGTIHVRNGGLYVEGLTDLDQTTINTTDGKFHVLGPNKVELDISGGATSSIEFTAEDLSFFKTTAGTLTLTAEATDANGKVNIIAAGTGTDSILLDATNATNGQITIQSAGADGASDAIRLVASDTVGGNVLIQANGDYSTSVPAIRLLTNNATSGQIALESAGGSTTSDAIKLLATDTTEGNVLVRASGGNASGPSININAENTTSGQVSIRADGNLTDSIRILANNATSGGIDIDAVGGPITIDTTNTTTGVTIATVTEGVPVTIGTGTSLTTIAGDFLVEGSTTTFNVETLTVEDNIILLNSGNGELDIDSGVVIRRYQTPNNAGTGNVVTGPNPIQESGAFQSGSATPGTLVLDAHASATDNFYNGWWIKITSGTGVDQVRRIKSYVGSSRTATIYVTADNTSAFTDGLDLVSAPAAADTYNFYSDSYSMTYFDESENRWNFVNTSLAPDAISAPGASTAAVQQYQEINSGALDIFSQVYRNAKGSASATTITLTLIGHGLAVGDKIGVSDSNGFTPVIPTNAYEVTTVPSVDTVTIEVPASTTSASGSSVTITDYKSSKIKVNVIESHDPGAGGINIPGITCSEDIDIPKTSTDYFFVDNCTNLSGAYLVVVGDLNNTDGAFSVFAAARSGGTGGGSVSRIASSKGADGQRIDADWSGSEKLKIKHKPAGSGAGNYTYRVRVFSSI